MFIFPKKSLGQHFLRSKKILERVIEAGEVGGGDLVLEVGPGKGFLTERLLRAAREVAAVEKDDRLIIRLNLKFRNEIAAGKLKIIHRDILEFDPAEVKYQSGGYKIIANIPYYITGAFIRRFLAEVTPPGVMILMVQKEVARRIMARDGKESMLSLGVKAYGVPEYLETVKAENFSPKPKVDSALIAVRNIGKNFFSDLDEKFFFELASAAFRGKRRMLRKSLENFLGEAGAEVFSAGGVRATARPEDLSVSDWKRLAKAALKIRS